MINKLNLLDPIDSRKQHLNSVWFTWCNYQQLTKRIYCRLDRFYFNKNHFDIIKANNGDQYSISPFTLSDHQPILMCIGLSASLPPPTVRTNCFTLNSRLLDDADLCSTMAFTRLFNKSRKPKLSNINRWTLNIKS